MKKLVLFLVIFCFTIPVWSADLFYQSDMVTAVRDYLLQTNSANSNFTDAQIKFFVQQALYLVYGLNVNQIEKIDTVITSANTAEYGSSLNSDLVKIKAVWRKSGKSYVGYWQTAPENWNDVTTDPTDTSIGRYTYWGTDTLTLSQPRFWVRPTPTKIDTLIVFYYARPKFLTATDTTINLVQPYRSYVPLVATGFALLSLGRLTEAKMFFDMVIPNRQEPAVTIKYTEPFKK